MNRFFLIILLIFGGSDQLSAQFSFQTHYHSHLSNNEDESWPAHSMVEGSVHYWTRLKKYRVEFYPGILMQAHQLKENGHSLNLGLSLPIVFYPMDFVNDCDCPTFSKNAYWFQKGFFLRMTPSWSTQISGSTEVPFDQILGAGISLGLDFGLSDLITLSPMAGYQFMSSLSHSGHSVSSIQFGLSLLFRNDYRNRYR